MFGELFKWLREWCSTNWDEIKATKIGLIHSVIITLIIAASCWYVTYSTMNMKVTLSKLKDKCDLCSDRIDWCNDEVNFLEKKVENVQNTCTEKCYKHCNF